MERVEESAGLGADLDPQRRRVTTPRKDAAQQVGPAFGEGGWQCWVGWPARRTRAGVHDEKPRAEVGGESGEKFPASRRICLGFDEHVDDFPARHPLLRHLRPSGEELLEDAPP
ncbi:MAG: hypothetical protein EB141_13305 [Verrucomicrobia bacterium]|nr:hypothetical protein [Verrucomicrobiota bacterium]NBU07655.1 hypothetical protein [Pseudomonadota bacterium]NDA65243.1 hypothetical protein [Verrucomicrobiota bacterium]NDB76596.1 hypothetical protein [Verrucomicrobiota bacterium]NDD36985.1 hypothetical protein [Verrucomicrobiota bacterium]